MSFNISILVLAAVIAWLVVSRRRLQDQDDKKNSRNFRKIDQNKIEKTQELTRREKLSSKQLEQINLIHQSFLEVYPISLEDMKNNLQRDNEVDKEIDLWLTMRDSYLAILAEKKYSDIKTKKEVFQLIWMSTMVPREEIPSKIRIKILSQEELEYVLNDFSRRRK